MKLVIAWLLSLGLACAAHGAEGDLKSGTFEPPRVAPAISLQGSDGDDLALDRYRGKVVVLGFGFTHCPEVCPTTLAKLAKARKSLGARARDLQVLYITVDPERDNATRMREYLANFDPTFVGGTGTSAQIAKVEKDYGIVAEKKMSAMPGIYFVDHSSFVYLIDREGRLRAMVPYAKSAEDIAHDAAILLGR
jgi:protein SCO1/2